MAEIGTSWSELYRQAILETDPTVLTARIDAARAAIQRRARELWYANCSGTKERQDLDAALHFLGLLRTMC
jgi:hypothetical protein